MCKFHISSVNNSTFTIFIPKRSRRDIFAYILLFKFNNNYGYEKVYFTYIYFWISFLLSKLLFAGFGRLQNSRRTGRFRRITFHAQRANPMNYEVINVMGSIQNAPSARMLQLDGENYTIELKKNNLEVVLPYFGRLFNASYNTANNSYHFTSKDFTVTKSQNKKGNWTVKIKPTDVGNVDEINIEIFKNGKAFVSMRSNDRQPITYDGYVSKNEETAKKKDEL